MKKHNDNHGGAPDLDELLQKLKERHDAREKTGIFTPEDEVRRRFFQAAHAQERPHFPMIWKAAAMLGCSRNTLYQRIHKAKQLLAKSIREVSYEEA